MCIIKPLPLSRKKVLCMRWAGKGKNTWIPKDSSRAVALLEKRGIRPMNSSPVGQSLVTLRRPTAQLKTFSLWAIFSHAFELNPFSRGFGLKVVWEIWINQEIFIYTTLCWGIKDFLLRFLSTWFQSVIRFIEDGHLSYVYTVSDIASFWKRSCRTTLFLSEEILHQFILCLAEPLSQLTPCLIVLNAFCKRRGKFQANF